MQSTPENPATKKTTSEKTASEETDFEYLEKQDKS